MKKKAFVNCYPVRKARKEILLGFNWEFGIPYEDNKEVFGSIFHCLCLVLVCYTYKLISGGLSK
jgi:hypothetical protein